MYKLGIISIIYLKNKLPCISYKGFYNLKMCFALKVVFLRHLQRWEPTPHLHRSWDLPRWRILDDQPTENGETHRCGSGWFPRDTETPPKLRKLETVLPWRVQVCQVEEFDTPKLRMRAWNLNTNFVLFRWWSAPLHPLTFGEPGSLQIHQVIHRNLYIYIYIIYQEWMKVEPLGDHRLMNFLYIETTHLEAGQLKKSRPCQGFIIEPNHWNFQGLWLAVRVGKVWGKGTFWWGHTRDT